VASTVWNEDNDTRIVWITMLALADRYGDVEGSVPGLAVLARVSVDGCRAALTKLSNPDPDSRNKYKEGRRIEAIDGGWRIINYDDYRKKLSKEERAEYQRLWQAQKRARAKAVDSASTVSTEVEKSHLSREQRAEEPPTPFDAVDDDADPFDAPDPVLDAVRWFVESYPVWFAQERNGARYMPAAARDWEVVKTLVQTWPEREHLERMARTYLGSHVLDAQAFHNSRSIGKFAAEASGIDAHLRGQA
jgi:hypothetical protein